MPEMRSHVCFAGLLLILALGVFLPMWDMASAARGGGGAK